MTTTLITGANRGIGLELARQLVAAGHRVLGTTRDDAPELAALGVEVLTLDVTHQASIDALALALQDTQLDWLILNAGILIRTPLDDLGLDAVRRQFEVNALGPLRIVAALRTRLEPGSKIAVLTSRMGSIGDNTSGGRYGYRMSKAAVNMAGVSLARDLASEGVSVALLHPGFVRTAMTGHSGFVDPPEAAVGLIQRIEELSLETSGGFWHANGERLPW
jgi:NAD(P)-dependent dehydrogenase (short-subunit alcohol dehydrogenase family)